MRHSVAAPKLVASKREALSRIHAAQTNRLPPVHALPCLNGLWLAVVFSAHCSATMASAQFPEFDLAKCFQGTQQLV
jgi:hypothetical protein